MVHWAWLLAAATGGAAFGFLFCSLVRSSDKEEDDNDELTCALLCGCDDDTHCGDCPISKEEKGFTLIELVISIFIAMIIMGGMLNFFINQSRSYGSNEVALVTLQDTRATINTMITDIRLAGYKTSAAPFCGIASANGTSIRVLSDLNQDGSTTGTNEDLTYSWNSGNKQLTQNGTLFLDNVSALSFSYTLDDGSVTSTPADLTKVRKITLSISVQSQNLDPLTHTPKVFTMASDITPRNLGL